MITYFVRIKLVNIRSTRSSASHIVKCSVRINPHPSCCKAEETPGTNRKAKETLWMARCHLWMSKTQKMTGSSCHRSGHKSNQNQRVMMPKTIQDSFRKLKRVLLGRERGPQQVSTCGGSGGTAPKAALSRAK